MRLPLLRGMLQLDGVALSVTVAAPAPPEPLVGRREVVGQHSANNERPHELLGLRDMGRSGHIFGELRVRDHAGVDHQGADLDLPRRFTECPGRSRGAGALAGAAHPTPRLTRPQHRRERATETLRRSRAQDRKGQDTAAKNAEGFDRMGD